MSRVAALWGPIDAGSLEILSATLSFAARRLACFGTASLVRGAARSAPLLLMLGLNPKRTNARNVALKVHVEKTIGSGTLRIETGLLAKQAAGSCMVQFGETVVLTAVASGPPRPGVTDFFPLTCDYRERTAAAGKFPGGFLKREGRPTTKETLTSRLMDRPIRPLFPDWFRDEVQIQSFVMASDRQNDGDVLAMIGASVSLGLSPLPFLGPIGSVRLGRVDGQFIPFPTQDELEESDLDLIVSGNQDSVLMIEGFAREFPEDEMLEAIRVAHGYIQQICDLQLELFAKVKVEKTQYPSPRPTPFTTSSAAKYYAEFKAAKQTSGKHARADAVAALEAAATTELIPDPAAPGAISANAFASAWHRLEEHVVRDLILAGTRADGRDHKSLRAIDCHVDVLPRVHGSAVFQRGETQALITVTLGTGRDEQRVDGLIDEYSKKFMLDYNFPSFSVGEVRPIRGPGRREIGHGALAERSVKPMLPDPEEFPYTIRVISDILESNGSSSMASVCGATLGLMAAGVPIQNPVAGISVGLVKESDQKWLLLTDIIGDEDHFGDMDFKVAGTQNGVTGIQLDLKIAGISFDIIKATLAQSREARIEILRKMLTAIPRPEEGNLDVCAAAAANPHPAGQDRRADRAGRQEHSCHPRGHRRRDRSRRRRHRDHRLCQWRVGPGSPRSGRVDHRVGSDRSHLSRPGDQRQGFRRLRRDPARQGRPVPHQRAVRRIRQQRRRCLQGGRRTASQGDRRRRARSRQAQPQAGNARTKRKGRSAAAPTA